MKLTETEVKAFAEELTIQLYKIRWCMLGLNNIIRDLPKTNEFDTIRNEMISIDNTMSDVYSEVGSVTCRMLSDDKILIELYKKFEK